MVGLLAAIFLMEQVCGGVVDAKGLTEVMLMNVQQYERM